MSFRPRRVLVTGGAGFIGASYVRQLLASDPDVVIVNLDALTYAGCLDNLADLPAPQRHVFVQGSIIDTERVTQLLRSYDIDTVVNFAAESHVDRSIAGPQACLATNVQGTFSLLEAVRRVWLEEQGLKGDVLATRRRFHQISTDEVYGSLAAGAPAFTEANPYRPNSPYAASKASADHLVRAWAATWGLPVLVTACSNNYGPRQHGEKFIPVIIRSCLEQQPIPVYGDGGQSRDWLHVDDHCRALLRVLHEAAPGSTYNIGGDNEWRNIELARLLCRFMDEQFPQRAPHEQLIRFVPDRLGHDHRYAIDASRLRSELGWQPQVRFDCGLRATLQWYLDAARAVEDARTLGRPEAG